MFQRIVVAVDLSQTCQQVVDEAIQLAQHYGAKLMLLHVLSTQEEIYPPYSLYPLMEYYSEFTEKALQEYENSVKVHENACLKKLTTLRQQAIDHDLEAEALQTTGGAGHSICETAQEWNADLILLGNRGRTGLSEMFLGSVSNFVMHHASCSVLILRPLEASNETELDKSQCVEV